MTVLVSARCFVACFSVAAFLGWSAGAVAAEHETAPPELLEPSFELPSAWTGDLDGMVERRVIRVLTTFSKTGYFLDGLQQRGVTYEALQAFEQFLNERLGTPRSLPVRVLIVPVDRDTLLPALVDGHGDIAAANLTVTEERLALVDFSDPLFPTAREVLVTGPAAPHVASRDDLAGRTMHLRRSSSYWASIEALNKDLVARGLAPIALVEVEPFLEDEDLLEMVAAGILPWLVVDEHKALLWVDVLDGLELHEVISFREDAPIAWAMRKNAPQLAELVNAFVPQVKKGTATGNVLIKRYLQANPWVRNPQASEDRARFEATAELFQHFGEQYGFDWLMVAAQGYQESRIDQSVRSPAGAIGIMQVLPSTAADRNVGIPDISQPEPNIHAGVKYLRFLVDRYLDDPAIDDFNRTLFAFAAYNAGPGNLRRIREETAAMGLDANVWFRNAEVAAAKVIGREVTTYVANIAKYSYAFRMIEEQRAAAGLAD